MNDYKELIDILRDVDFVDSCAHYFLPCSGSGNCFVLKTADAIEQLVKERDITKSELEYYKQKFANEFCFHSYKLIAYATKKNKRRFNLYQCTICGKFCVEDLYTEDRILYDIIPLTKYEWNMV